MKIMKIIKSDLIFFKSTLHLLRRHKPNSFRKTGEIILAHIGATLMHGKDIQQTGLGVAEGRDQNCKIFISLLIFLLITLLISLLINYN